MQWRELVRVGRARDLLFLLLLLAASSSVNGADADECEDDTWCFPGVCVSGQCEPCTEAPAQCENHPSLHDAFCDWQSGDCWENTDCLPYVGNASLMECSECTASGAMSCPFWEYCEESVGFCVPIPGPALCSEA